MTRVKYLCTLANVIKVVSRTELWIDSWCDVISVPWSNLVHWSVPLSLEENCSVSVCPIFSTTKKKTKCPAVVTQFLRLMTASPWRGCAFSKSGWVMGWRSCGTSLWLGCTCPPTRLLRPRVLRGTKFWASAMLQVPMRDIPLTDRSVKCQRPYGLLVLERSDSTACGVQEFPGLQRGGRREREAGPRGWTSHIKCGSWQVC